MSTTTCFRAKIRKMSIIFGWKKDLYLTPWLDVEYYQPTNKLLFQENVYIYMVLKYFSSPISTNMPDQTVHTCIDAECDR